MKNILYFLLILSSPLFAQKQEGIVSPSDYKNPVGDTLKVLTWNVEHFVDKHDNPYINAKRENQSPETKIQKRIGFLVEALQKIEADIVVFQEFESQAFLQKIIKENLSEMGYRFFASSPSPNWYMNVIVMSRVPLGVIYGYGSVITPVKGSLDKNGLPETQNMINTRMWSVDVLVNDNYSFVLTGLHLKAGRRERDVSMRKGQINFLLGQFNRFIKEDKKTNILVAGDLNSISGSNELDLFTKGKGKVKFVDPLSEKKALSHPADSPERLLDYILPNTQMSKKLININVVKPFDAEKMREISDHLPVLGKFLVK